MHLRSACADIFRFVQIRDPFTLRLGGTHIRCDPERLLLSLQGVVYCTFFCGMARSEPTEPPEEFRQALSAANAGTSTRIAPGIGLGVGTPMNPAPKESFTQQPGAYLAFGPRAPAGTKWLRLYWNVSPRGAAALVAAATAVLNRDAVPFQLKVLLDTGTRRRDAAVLYLPDCLWPAAGKVIAAVGSALDARGDLRAETPLFARRLRPGIALAEDPGRGLSFGMHRSWLVARSLAASHLRGHAREDEQWSDLQAQFAAEGLSIEHPHLNAGSADVYEL